MMTNERNPQQTTETQEERKIRRDKKRQELREQHQRNIEHALTTIDAGTPEQIMEEIRKTNLAYLFNRTPKAYVTREPLQSVNIHKAIGGGTLPLPANTPGWIFSSVEKTFSEYVWIDDWQVPAKDARVIKTKTYFTFVTLCQWEGQTSLLSHFATVERNFA